jgi:hypothetical protein
MLIAGEDAKERALSRTVLSGDRHLVSVFHVDVEIIEHQLPPIGFREPRDPEVIFSGIRR